MNTKFRIYLSSTKYHWWNLISNNWKKVIGYLIHKEINNDIELFDPLNVITNDPEICTKDLKDIEESDFVVVYIDKLTIGTLLELGRCVFYTKTPKDFCVLSFNNSVLKHPWIIKLCGKKVFSTFQDCVKYIHSIYNIKSEIDKGTSDIVPQKRFG